MTSLWRKWPDYSDHPRKLVTLNPKLKSTGAGLQKLSRWWDAYRKQLGLKDFSEKSDAVALQQIKERGALPMIDRGDIRQAIDHYPYIWTAAPGAALWSDEHKADSLIANSKKRAERSGEVVALAIRVTAIISALILCIIVCLSWAVNHYPW